MLVYHIFEKEEKFICTVKKPFIGKEKTASRLPSFSEIFAKETACVVFKLPDLFKAKQNRLRLLIIALASFLSFKYYSFRVPFLFANFLEKNNDKDIYLIGGEMGSELIEFHYVNTQLRRKSVIVSGIESINLIAKNNRLLKLLPKKSYNSHNKIYSVGLFSMQLLEYVSRSFPNANFELRYFDAVKPKRLNVLKNIIQFCKTRDFKITGYEKKLCEQLAIPYEINKINDSKLSQLSVSNKVFDLAFLGLPSKSRMDQLKKIIFDLSSSNLQIKLVVPGFSGSIGSVEVDDQLLPYEDYLKVLAKSKCVLDLWRLYPTEGYSFRIAESMALKTKVITNRVGIKDEPFYDNSRFLVINDFSGLTPKLIEDFLKTPYKPIEQKFYAID